MLGIIDDLYLEIMQAKALVRVCAESCNGYIDTDDMMTVLDLVSEKLEDIDEDIREIEYRYRDREKEENEKSEIDESDR